MRSRLIRQLALLMFFFAGMATAHVLLDQDSLLAQDKSDQTPQIVLPGPLGKGVMQLPTQWTLKPAGKHVPLGDFPVNVAVHPTLPIAVVLHAGYADHEIVTVDLKSEKVLSRVPVAQAFYGLAISPKGDEVFASGGEREVVYRLRIDDKGLLYDLREIAIVPPKQKFVVTGVALSRDGKTLFAAGGWGAKIAMVGLDPPAAPSFIELESESYPYGLYPSADGKRLFVSQWLKESVVEIDLTKKKVVNKIETPRHPCEMIANADESLLYVACANSNAVVIVDLKEGKRIEQLSAALYPEAMVGSTPNSLALSPDGRALLVANADNNNVAVFDVSTRGKSKSLGYIPAGWYPTSVRFAAEGSRILIANGKGLGSKANRLGPAPGKESPATIREYIGKLFTGTLTVMTPPTPVEMARFTKEAFACSPLLPENGVRNADRSADNPIPTKVGDPSPIKYCLYIVKENRTYDQVLGDLQGGNGDASLCLFPEKVTPNHHALAREFVTLDNFYVESEVSADGHEWSMAAYATDFVEKTWPLVYRGGDGKLVYPSEGAIQGVGSAGGYIWDRCAEAGVSFRTYGEFTVNPPNPKDPVKARLKSLEGKFDPHFRSYDLDYSDIDRANRFISELKRFEAEGDMPRMQIMRLPNDHTHGTAAGKLTPTAMVAENDVAFGMVIEAISQSKFWPEMAVFVVEDDAQNGSDHVDAHRTIAFCISPYTKRKIVDSNLYSTASMLRTMELILGLKPMSQFDAAALPMYGSFQAKPDLTRYLARPAQVDLKERNLASAWGAKESLAMDFSREDAADDLQLNEVIWRSVRGANSPMPAPVRASFVFAKADDDDDEEEGEDEDDDDDDEHAEHDENEPGDDEDDDDNR
jgi:YVTN family beta-propeller protein